METKQQQHTGVIEHYQNLTFTNDFIFCKVMSDDPILCRDLIRICTGLEVGNLELDNAQQVFKVTPEGHGVRLDVYVEDDNDHAFDLEMENRNRGGYGERTVYYLGMMGRKQLKMAESYGQLKDNYVIFIMPFNLFPEAGLHKYTFVSQCLEAPELRLNDKCERIFICGKGSEDKTDVSKELKALIKYIETNEIQNDFTRRLDNAVKKARSNREWEAEYMELCERYKEYLMEGRAEGRAEGLEEGIKIGKANLEKEIQRADAAERELARYKAKYGNLDK